MQKYSNDLASTISGVLVPVSLASCTVYNAGTLTPATIYSGNGTGLLANPFNASSTGRIEFYAADGRYDLSISGTGYATVTVSDIILEDPADSLDTHNLTVKTTPVDADELKLADSAASWASKKFTFGNLKTVLSTLYANLAGSSTQDFSAQKLTTRALATDQVYVGTSTYTVLPTDTVINMGVGATCTVTLPTPNLGRILIFKNATAFAVNSASTNVFDVSNNLTNKILNSSPGWCVLQSDGANWVTIEKSIQRITLVATRDVSLATGNVAYTGSGFTPRKVTLLATIDGTPAWSNGTHDGSANNCMLNNYAGVSSNIGKSASLGTLVVSAGNSNTINVVSFDVDGCTLSYTKNGSPTGTANIVLFLEG